MPKSATKKDEFRYNIKDKDVPATQRMLYLVRNQIQSDVQDGFLRSGSKIGSMVRKLDSFSAETFARFEQIDTRFEQMEASTAARFAQMEASTAARFDQMEARTNARFEQVEARLDRLEKRMDRLEERMTILEKRMDRLEERFENFQAEMRAGFARVESEISRLGVLIEEQNARNRIVLEGMSGLWSRQERVEHRLDNVEDIVRWIAKGRTSSDA